MTDNIKPEDFPISGEVWAAIRDALVQADSLCQIANASATSIPDDVKLRVLPGAALGLQRNLAHLMELLDALPDDWMPGTRDTL